MLGRWGQQENRDRPARSDRPDRRGRPDLGVKQDRPVPKDQRGRRGSQDHRGPLGQIQACRGPRALLGPLDQRDPAGAQGPAGPAGAPGPQTRIVRTYFCSEVNLPHDGLNHTFRYNLAEFSDGFIFVSGQASGLYYSATDAMFYAPTQVGFALGRLNMVASSSSVLAGSGVYDWVMTLDRTSNTFRVANLAAMTFVQKSCTPNVY